MRIMASLLTADLSRLGEEVRGLVEGGVDGIHWDIMDGKATPGFSFGPPTIASCRPVVDAEFEAHVMVEDPGPDLLRGIADAGCALTMVHTDMLRQPWRTAVQIRELGMRCGMVLSPAVPVSAVRWLLPLIDRILVMTVEPGYGGQSYIASMERKVAEVRALLDEWDGRVDIEVDGGIGVGTVGGAYGAGARVFVVGSALWSAPSFRDAVEGLRAAVPAASPPHDPTA